MRVGTGNRAGVLRDTWLGSMMFAPDSTGGGGRIKLAAPAQYYNPCIVLWCQCLHTP